MVQSLGEGNLSEYWRNLFLLDLAHKTHPSVIPLIPFCVGSEAPGAICRSYLSTELDSRDRVSLSMSSHHPWNWASRFPAWQEFVKYQCFSVLYLFPIKSCAESGALKVKRHSEKEVDVGGQRGLPADPYCTSVASPPKSRERAKVGVWVWAAPRLWNPNSRYSPTDNHSSCASGLNCRVFWGGVGCACVMTPGTAFPVTPQQAFLSLCGDVVSLILQDSLLFKCARGWLHPWCVCSPSLWGSFSSPT